VNLALALKMRGFKVGILDADIYGPSMRKMLPEDRLPLQKGNEIEPALCHGIKMISMAYFRKDHEASAVRAPIANGLISHFIKNILWGELDFLLIDFPPGTGDIQLTLSQKAQLMGAIMVTTPQEVSLMDVKKAISLFEQVKIPLIGVVENMSYYQTTHDERIYVFGKGGGEKLASQSGVPFLGQIPLDPLICTCGDAGISLFGQDVQAERPATRAFQQLASQLIEQVEQLKVATLKGIGEFQLIWKEMEER
jgi:ATP-binding protein involved in chromosome partitioning